MIGLMLALFILAASWVILWFVTGDYCRKQFLIHSAKFRRIEQRRLMLWPTVAILSSTVATVFLYDFSLIVWALPTINFIFAHLLAFHLWRKK